MKRLIFNFANLMVINLIARAQGIVVQMTGNPHFISPSPSLGVIQGMIDSLAASQIEMDAGNYTQKELRDSYRAVLVDGMNLLGIWVESVCNGDPIKLASSGFELAKTPEAVGVLPSPEGVAAELTGVSGEAFLKWKSVRKATCYLIEATAQNPASPESMWQVVGVSTKARYTCSGLTPALFYSFRVTAIGTGSGNNSAPSEPATTVIG